MPKCCDIGSCQHGMQHVQATVSAFWKPAPDSPDAVSPSRQNGHACDTCNTNSPSCAAKLINTTAGSATICECTDLSKSWEAAHVRRLLAFASAAWHEFSADSRCALELSLRVEPLMRHLQIFYENVLVLSTGRMRLAKHGKRFGAVV